MRTGLIILATAATLGAAALAAPASAAGQYGYDHGGDRYDRGDRHDRWDHHDDWRRHEQWRREREREWRWHHRHDDRYHGYYGW